MALLESSHDSKPPGLPAVQPEDENLTIKLPSSQPPPANAQPAVDPEPTATSSPPSVVTPAPATAKRNTTEDGKPRAKKRRAAAAATNYADVQDDELLKPSESLVIKPIEAAQLHPVQAEHRHWNHDHVELHTFDGPVLVKMWTPDPPVFEMIPNGVLKHLHDVTELNDGRETSSGQRSKDLKELQTIRLGLQRYKKQLKQALAPK